MPDATPDPAAFSNQPSSPEAPASASASLTPSLAPPFALSSKRGRYRAVVEANTSLCREHWRLRLRIPPSGAEGAGFPASMPGQFVQLLCRDADDHAASDAMLGRETVWSPEHPPRLGQPELCSPLALLRRPFSLADRGDDDRGTWLDVIHRVIGTGTAWLERLKPGDGVDLLGPLGNAFTLPADRSHGLLVGGGVGLPPMFYLARGLSAAGWSGVAFVGALTRDLLAIDLDDAIPVPGDGSPVPAERAFARSGLPVCITTDDGSMGLAGRITDGLARYVDGMPATLAAKTVVFTCGPHAMMRAVARLARERGLPCQVCVEQAMACGMGTCQSCVVKIATSEAPATPFDAPHGRTDAGQAWRFRLACTDGPVFDADEVIDFR